MDLKQGSRHFGTHPRDQVYCNGPLEHYIYMACPFGKTNSILDFSTPVTWIAMPFVTIFKEQMPDQNPISGSYVDDFLGGLKKDPHEKALVFGNIFMTTEHYL